MSKTAKNLIIVLGLITVALAAYFALMQSSNFSLDFKVDEEVLANMQANSQTFIERRRDLQVIRLDTAIFSDERFRNLRSFDESIIEQPVGRDNLFLAPGT